MENVSLFKGINGLLGEEGDIITSVHYMLNETE